MKRHVYSANARNEDMACTLSVLGLEYKDLGEYDTARVMYEEALDMFRHVYGPDVKNADLAATIGNYDVAKFFG